jgi:uncharacterized damage-inducible protein DinB
MAQRKRSARKRKTAAAKRTRAGKRSMGKRPVARKRPMAKAKHSVAKQKSSVTRNPVPNRERDRILEQLKRAFEADAWSGPSVLEVLEGVTWERAAEKPIPEAHSIWEIVLHMTTWENVVRRRLMNETVNLTPEEDWPPVNEKTEAAWTGAVRALEAGHERLRQTAAKVQDGLLDQSPGGKYSTRYVLLHGIIQHDLYHAGQIAVLKKG